MRNNVQRSGKSLEAVVLRLALAFGAALMSATLVRADGLASMSSGWVFNEQGGEALFANICAGCHQPDARGAAGAGVYPALAGNPNLASREYVEAMVLAGRRAMPPLGAMLSDAQVADVVNYARAHFGNAYTDEVSPSDVKAARAQVAPRP